MSSSSPLRRLLRRGRRRVRRLRRRTRRFYWAHRTPIRISTLAVGALVVLGAVWIGVTALLARAQLKDLDDRLVALRTAVATGHLDDARRVARTIPDVAERVHDLTTGPAWWAAAHVPVLGTPLEVARGTAAASGRAGTEVIPELVRVVDLVDPDALRTAPDTVDLAPLSEAAPVLQRASRQMAAASAELDDVPSGSWFAPVDRGRDRVRTTLDALRGYVDAAARSTRVLPTMLGASRPQTYFIGLQNEAELRGTGGLPGAFAIAVADHGRVRFTRFESNARLNPPGAALGLSTGLSFGPGYDSAYGASLPTSSFYNSNVSPSFPYAARIWAAMWQKTSGQRVDGVLALDPQVLGYFLAATGPVQAHGYTITAANVVTLLQRDQYQLFSNDFLGRKDFVVDVLRAVSRRITAGGGSGLGLARAATRSAGERRLLAWSRDPAVQRAVVATDYGGTLPGPGVAFAGLVLNNASGGKIDFYVTRSLQYQRTGCGPTRDVLATVTLRNDAPSVGLPAYVTDRADVPPPGARPGDVREIVDFYATSGAQLLGVTLDGRSSTAAVLDDLDHPIFRTVLELPRGTTRTIVLHLREPATDGPAVVLRQPGVTPLVVQQDPQRCG